MFKNKKIPHLDFIPIFLIIIVLYKLIANVTVLASWIGSFFSILNPFIWAFAIAYLLNPLMSFLEKRFKLNRGISLLITYLIVIGFITIFSTILIPKATKSITDLFKNMPTYLTQTEAWVEENLTNLKIADRHGIIDYTREHVNSLIKELGEIANSSLNTAVSKTVKFTSSFLKAVFGFIIAIYLLKDKEKFNARFKKFICVCIKDDNKTNRLFSFLNEVDHVFLQYIIGKFIDSLIIGVLCFIGVKILKAPYAVVIALIVGITNMIPYFGPLIGMIPSFIIVLFFNPMKAVWVLIFIILLQQFDGWYLGPKILGEKVGLSPFWIILAITIGGGLFGVLGMFLSVPVMAILKNYIDKFIEERSNKNSPDKNDNSLSV